MSYQLLTVLYHTHSLKLTLVMHLSAEIIPYQRTCSSCFSSAVRFFTFSSMGLFVYLVGFSCYEVSLFQSLPSHIVGFFIPSCCLVLAFHRLRNIAHGWMLLKREVKE